MTAQLNFLDLPTLPPEPVRRGSDREDAIRRLKDEVWPELSHRALERVNREEAPGVTADDVVQLCKGKPYSALLGDGQRAYSWVGPWLAALARVGLLVEYRIAGQSVRRRSTRPSSHGNLQVVYLHHVDRRAQGAA